MNAHQPVNSTVLNLREPLTPRTQFVRSLASAAVLVALAGCEADSWMDPSRTGYFETTPTTMPILARLDVIDQAGIRGAHISSPTAEDLVPSELKYRLSPGDRVRIEIFELIAPGETEIIERTIDQTGNIPIKQLGDVVAAGHDGNRDAAERHNVRVDPLMHHDDERRQHAQRQGDDGYQA